MLGSQPLYVDTMLLKPIQYAKQLRLKDFQPKNKCQSAQWSV